MTRRRWLATLGVLCALNASLWLATSGFALPAPLANYFFGPGLVRAEVVHKSGGVLRDYRIDKGRVRQVASGSITLLERDGSLVTVPVAADARIRLNGSPVSLSALRRGTVATTIRDGGRPAETVIATRR